MTRPQSGPHEQPRRIVTLANGLPAFTRDRRITQSDLNRYGSRAAALEAKRKGN